MVNIISITHITPTRVQHFDNADAFWATSLQNVPIADIPRVVLLEHHRIITEQVATDVYQVTPEQARHVTLIFGSAQRTLIKLAYPEIRDLVFNHENTIILQIKQWEAGTRCDTIATIHTRDSCFIILNSIRGNMQARG